MRYAAQRVLVLGMARSGRAAVELLLRHGARVFAYDRDPERLSALPPGVEPLSGAHPPALESFDFAVVSPGVPVPPSPRVVPEVDLAAAHLDAPLVGITGSNGKSTTTTLVALMLQASGLRTAVGGNLGTPLCALVEQGAQRVVAELSSFQLEHARRLHAEVAVLLNLSPDHLDRHGSLAAYGAAKARLAELQRAADALVFNLEDPWARAVAERAPAGRHIGFSARGAPGAAARLERGELVVERAGGRPWRMALDALSGAARTPVDNALAAAAAALAAGGTPEGIAAVLASFAGLPHRVSPVCTRAGVRWIDDSKATNPAAALASAAAYAPRLVWLLGGRNKGLDLAPLREVARGIRGALAYGEAAGELERALAGACPLRRVCTLDEAVAAAAEIAQPGDAVLLAPACASFDQFRSFEERGDRFAALVRALPSAPEALAC
jgi:UDP-N-acetylmuramoylalanine--D-glutamate ligase